MPKNKIGVLVSGGGSNLQSIIDNIHFGTCDVRIACVISNVPNAYALQRAVQANIPGLVVNHKHYANRLYFEQTLLKHLREHQVDLVVLAGFMRVLEATFIDYFSGRILNIHPSLLPAFPGLHTHKRALNSHQSEHGCSVHFATTELDGGPVILQAKVPIFTEDNVETLAKRVLEKEHIIYPLCVQWLCEGRIYYQNNRAYYNEQPLKQPLQLDEL